MDEKFPVGEFQTDNRKQNMTRSMTSSSVMHNNYGFVLDVTSNINVGLIKINSLLQLLHSLASE